MSEANRKAKQRIRNGSVVLVLALLGAVSLGGLAAIEGNKALEAQIKADDASEKAKIVQNQLASVQEKIKIVEKNVNIVDHLSKLAGNLSEQGLIAESEEAFRKAGLSFVRVNDNNLRRAMLLASISEAYQHLKNKKEAETNINESLNYLNNIGNKISSSDERLQIQFMVKYNQGKLLTEELIKLTEKFIQ
ncbi:MAG: hypothetical protein AAF915_01575 [Cyanobacteria bacterium P01_D01_bin.50]